MRLPSSERCETEAAQRLGGGSCLEAPALEREGKPMQPTPELRKSQVLIMATAAGIFAANLYYNQPILAQMAATFGATESAVGKVPALTQAGYGAGLFFLTPLGDMIERKRLIAMLGALLTLALAATTLVPSLAALLVVSFLVGAFSVAAQVILPFAAAMAKPERRGEVVGAVFTGLLIGILGARVGGGFVAEHFGWRWVYALSAVLVVGGVAAIWTRLPTLPSHYDGGYGALLRSTLQQVARFALLRRVMLIAALAFGTFCSFWTTLTFHLSGAPFHYGSDVIGLFGILAIAGALSAKFFGKLADNWPPLRTQIVTIGLIVVSIVLIQILPFSLCAFIVATLLLDVGMQATQVTNIAQIFTLDPAAYSRINTAFMTTVFFGGAVGSFAGVAAWSFGGWTAVCWQLLASSLAALLVVVAASLSDRRGAEGVAERG
jgi:predicted MFS family arabinose efflux permease